MGKLSVQEILTKFKNLKSRQIENVLSTLIIGVERDGSLSIMDQENPVDKLMFDSGQKALEYLENNCDGKKIDFDYYSSLPDQFYIDGVLLFCMNQDERKRFSEHMNSGFGYGCVLLFYIEMAKKYVFECDLPEDGFLYDLRKHVPIFTLETLYMRYYGDKWFKHEQY